VSRLEAETGGKVAVEEPQAVTTVLVASERTLTEQRAIVAAFVAAHRELTEWIKANPAEAQAMAQKELAEEVRGAVSDDLIARAWKRITLVDRVDAGALNTFVDNARKAGFMRTAPDLSRLIETP